MLWQSCHKDCNTDWLCVTWCKCAFGNTSDEMNILLKFTTVCWKWPASFERKSRAREEGGLNVLVPRVGVGGWWVKGLFIHRPLILSFCFPLLYSHSPSSCSPHLHGEIDRPGDTPLTPGAASSRCSHRVHKSINAHTDTHAHTNYKKQDTKRGYTGRGPVKGSFLQLCTWKKTRSPLGLAFSHEILPIFLCVSVQSRPDLVIIILVIIVRTLLSETTDKS